MKQKLALLMTLAVSAACVMAQGTINFQNGGPGVNAIIRGVDGTTALDGAGYQADLYWALGTVTDPGALASAGFSTSFGTGATAGYFFGGVLGIPTTAATGGQLITVQVRAWRLSDGATWLAASQAAGGQFGSGNLIQVTTGGGPNPPPFMVGLTPFNLTGTIIPEPSTFVLAGLGVASLLLFRRRK